MEERMEISLARDIERGLTEKRAQLDEWCESCKPVDKEIRLGGTAEAELQQHLHTIDVSLQELDQGTLGVCEVCQGIVDSRLLRMDYTSCICLDHYSEQERRRLEDDLELSQVVQRSLLPQKTPSIPGMDVSAFSRPAQIIGGDYYDFLHFKDGMHGFVVADVSGHGISAGMIMTSLQTAFQTLVPDYRSVVEVLERINRLYIHNINFTTFVTIFFGRLDPVTRLLTYASAGHNEAYLYRRKSRQDEWLGPTGAAIGLMEDFKIASSEVKLDSGDILMVYTDGISEAENASGEMYGRERLARVIRKYGELPAAELMQNILRDVNDFTGGIPLADDLTLMAYKAA